MKGNPESMRRLVSALRATAQSMRDHMREDMQADWKERYEIDIERNEQRARRIEERLRRRGV